MADFKQAYTAWLEEVVEREENVRRRERLAEGLGHGTVEFLRRAWFPAIGGFQHLHPEWEVRDMGEAAATSIWLTCPRPAEEARSRSRGTVLTPGIWTCVVSRT